jgi:hypothetical protein
MLLTFEDVTCTDHQISGTTSAWGVGRLRVARVFCHWTRRLTLRALHAWAMQVRSLRARAVTGACTAHKRRAMNVSNATCAEADLCPKPEVNRSLTMYR